MELSAGSAFFAAMFVLFGSMAIICWIADFIQKWHDKRHPTPKKKPLSITDFDVNYYRGLGRHKKEVNMKPGDKVWWFDARTQTIDCGEVIGVDERAGNVYTYDKKLWIDREGFPSRETLCEHYRKIFE